MKVIHLISGGDTGGAKTHVHSLLQESVPTHPRADMVCFMDGPFTQEARALGISVPRSFPGRNPLRTLRELRSQGRRRRAMTSSTATAPGATCWAPCCGRATGLPVVTTVHSRLSAGLSWAGPCSRLTYGTINAIALRLHPLPHRRIRRHGGPAYLNEALIRSSSSPSTTGIDFTPLRPGLGSQTVSAVRGTATGRKTAVVVGIAARLNPVKDIATLIRGFALARDDKPLTCGCSSPATDLMRASCSRRWPGQLGVADDVCFAGWVTDTRQLLWLSSISTPSPPCLRPFPMRSRRERCDLHCPTVATKVGGVPYLIDHGVNGLPVPAWGC